jgi:hypothetical protein
MVLAGEVDSEDEEEEDLRASIRSRVKGAATQVGTTSQSLYACFVYDL